MDVNRIADTMLRSRTRTTALAAGAVALGLALPSTAPAAYSGAISGTTATLTGDAAGDNVTVTTAGALLSHNLPLAQGFNSATDFDSTAAGDQTLPADATIDLVIDAGAGDDTITTTGLSAATIKSVTADGGAGDDLLNGSTRSDTLRGGDGDDRVVGAPGNDTMAGGNGDDTLVWNNGDNTDVMDGEGGQDTTEVNGAATAGDQFTIKPDGAARVRFDRTNLVPFALDIGTTERLAVNGLGGDDAVDATAGGAGLAGRILLALDGGTGADTLKGGDGPDAIAGGADNDTLDGENGDDRISGDRGDDAMRGGAGDDTLVWNNGDNSDVIDGEGGTDTTEVNGAPGAGDAFTLIAQNGRARFDRTNLVPFNLSIGSGELLDVRGLGGDDSFAPAASTAGVMSKLVLDGGTGNDALTGGDSADVLAGGSGADQLAGGAGSDSLDGGEGDDAISLRDGVADLATGRGGNDRAVADAAALDALDGVETADRPALPPAADTTAIPARIAVSRATVSRRGTTRITLSCAAAEGRRLQGDAHVDHRQGRARRPLEGHAGARLDAVRAASRPAQGRDGPPRVGASLARVPLWAHQRRGPDHQPRRCGQSRGSLSARLAAPHRKALSHGRLSCPAPRMAPGPSRPEGPAPRWRRAGREPSRGFTPARILKERWKTG
jgi:Ca2+-binding RTX toxin-like protein